MIYAKPISNLLRIRFSTGAWRTVHNTSAELAKALQSENDVEGSLAADAMASDAIARCVGDNLSSDEELPTQQPVDRRACEVASEAHFSEARFLEAAQLACAGRESFKWRTKQLAFVAEGRGLRVVSKPAADLVHLLPPAVKLPEL